MSKIFCGVCNINKYSRLCDYEVSEENGQLSLGVVKVTCKGEHPITKEIIPLCDYPMCEECSKKQGVLDYCPYHADGKEHPEDKPSNYKLKILEVHLAKFVEENK